MAPRVDPVASDETLPARADVVIIGGGIIGTSAALFLAQRGVSVALCEKGHIAGEQSSRNWGWCRKMARDPREIPAGHREPAAVAGDERDGRGRDRVSHLRHHVSRPRPKPSSARLEAWLDHAREYQLDTRVIDGAEVARLLPGLGQALGRRALYRQRRQGRAADGGAGDRRGGAAPRRGDPHRLRGARHRDRGRPGRRPSSPKRAASPASRSCWRAAPGRACSAAISASTCRS